jgi:outer membrane murein-binding lipoprotein Lpp
MRKNQKFSARIILGTIALTSVILVSCNNSGDSKDAKKDSVATPVVTTPPPAKPDSTKMDTAATKPVVLPNKNGKTN